MIEGLEQFANEVNDMDREWGPFLFLRPERHERMSSLRVAAFAALHGILAGLFVNLVARLTGEHEGHLSPLFFPAAATLGFFAMHRFTFAAAWNRRAARILRGERM